MELTTQKKNSSQICMYELMEECGSVGLFFLWFIVVLEGLMGGREPRDAFDGHSYRQSFFPSKTGATSPLVRREETH